MISPLQLICHLRKIVCGLILGTIQYLFLFKAAKIMNLGYSRKFENFKSVAKSCKFRRKQRANSQSNHIESCPITLSVTFRSLRFRFEQAHFRSGSFASPIDPNVGGNICILRQRKLPKSILYFRVRIKRRHSSLAGDCPSETSRRKLSIITLKNPFACSVKTIPRKTNKMRSSETKKSGSRSLAK